MNKVKAELKLALGLKFFTIFFGLFCLFLTGYSSLQAQDKHSQQNYQSGIPYAISDIESINVTNGNLMFNFDFGNTRGRGTANQGVSLKYNSKLYESHVQTTLDNSGNNSPQRFIRAGQEGGWQYDGDYQLRLINRNDDQDQPIQVGGGCEPPNYDGVFVHKLIVYFPDGSQHEFRPTGYSDSVYNSSGYSVYSGDGYFNIDANGTIKTLSWSSAASLSCSGTIYSTSVTTSYDPNPKMVYYSSDGTFMRLEIPKGQSYINQWTIYMPDGSKVTNGEIDAQNNVLFQRVYDKNGNFVTKGSVSLPDGSTVAGYIDQMGRYVAKKTISQTEDYIYKLGVGGEPVIWKVKWKYITVIRQYTTSGTSNGIGRCCYSDQVMVAQLKVVDEIETPSQLGGLKYTFTYNGHEGQVAYNQNLNNPNSSPGWGDLVDITLPSGAKAEYDYSIGPFIFTDQLLPILGKVKEKRLKHDSNYDGNTQQITETWLYSISQSGNSTITGPDGGITTQKFYSTNTDNDLSGRVYKETNQGGIITERIWANNKVVGCPQYGCGSMRRLNTYVKTEFTTIPDNAGNPSLTVIKDLEYDKNGNVTKVTEYDWVTYSTIPHDSLGKVTGIPGGATVKRITENTFYNQTEDASNTTANNSNSYWNSTAPNVRTAIKSTTTKQADGTPVSHSEFTYDNVNTTANLTGTKTWDSTKAATLPAPDGNGFRLNSGNSVITTAAYDPYGNPTLMTDAKGYQTQITYGTVGGYSDLYPTQTKTAYGTSVQRTSTAAYDFNTGLVTSATDVDNSLTSATVYDAVSRPKIVKAAVGTPSEIWTQTDYDDINRMVISRSDLFVKGDGKKVATQFYDQLGRVRLSKTLEDAAVQSATNETDGIKVQTRYQTGNPNSYQLTSNPYRAATSTVAGGEESMGWTRSLSVNTGRHAETEMFSGASLPAPWSNNTSSTGITIEDEDANATTVTDEAGKKRRTIEDAFGRLIRVDEPDGNNNLGSVSSPIQPTSYSYDALGNLTQIVQGGQTRSFTYSSLSRLLTATNPESGTFIHTYDNNGNLLTKKDARNVTTTYTYDALNRVTLRDYSDATPDIIYTYDDAQVPFSKGKLTKINSSVSETKYTAFDAQERILSSQQITDGQTYNFGYTYNLNGDLVTQTYPSTKVVKYDYDNGGDLAQVSNNQTQKVYANSFGYTAHGQVERMRLGNGKWETTRFNSALQITEVGLGHSATDIGLWKTNYEYGEWENNAINTQKNNGNLAQQTISVPTIGAATGFVAVQTYSYDKLDRVQSATETVSGNQTWKQTFLYDRFANKNFDTANGNTTTLGSCAAAVCNPTANQANNRLNGYGYDAAGNITTDGEGRTFTYDGENRQLTAVGSNLSMSYAYDGNDKRIKSFNAVTNQTTIFVYDSDGDLTAEYTINIPAPQSPTISYLTTDALGSVRVISNSFGEIKARRDFLPFGEEIYAGIGSRTTAQKYSANGDDTRKKFAAYQRDIETGLDYAQSRYYSPMTGRFTSPDEFKGGPDELFDFEDDASTNPTFYADLENPQSLNKYQYGYNNPYKYTDEDGHCPICVAVVVIAIAIATGPDYAVAPTGRETPEQMQEYRNTFGSAASSNVTPVKGLAVGGALLRNSIKSALTRTAVNQGTKQSIIKGYTKHGLNQAISRNGGRGVKAKTILKTTKSPNKVKLQTRNNRQSVKFSRGTGKNKSSVVIGENGKVVTVTGKARGPQIRPQGTTRRQGSGPAQRKANKRGFSYNPNVIH